MIEMQRRMKAGREYLAALRKLGFNPEALLWAGVGSADSAGAMELLVVTSWADNIGPKRIYDLLFEAYDASATPKDIDPFIVSLFSPHTAVARDLRSGLEGLRNGSLLRDKTTIFVLGMMDYYTIPQWIIAHRQSKSSAFEDARRFQAFQSNVAKLAA